MAIISKVKHFVMPILLRLLQLECYELLFFL